MNKKDVIAELTTKTGIDAEICESIVKGFEKVSEESLAAKFHGESMNMDEKISLVSEFTQVDEETCRIIVSELDTALESALSGKLRFFRKNQ